MHASHAHIRAYKLFTHTHTHTCMHTHAQTCTHTHTHAHTCTHTHTKHTGGHTHTHTTACLCPVILLLAVIYRLECVPVCLLHNLLQVTAYSSYRGGTSVEHNTPLPYDACGSAILGAWEKGEEGI